MADFVTPSHYVGGRMLLDGGPIDRGPRDDGLPTARSRLAARGPMRSGFGRWLLQFVVDSFAYGGCLHHANPDYLDFLRAANARPRR